tara:strand:+ start:668 stop:2206 length:1539 start_codon:yes stop_codon:yes gene_type:complete
MAAVERNNAAANTILATRAEYKPLDSSSMDETARWMRDKSYEQAQAKQTRTRTNQDALAAVGAYGLPKEQQGELNADVQKIYDDVNKGLIDVDSPDFRMNLQKINGKYNQFEATNTLTEQAISDGGFIVEKDAEGNYTDNFGGLRDEYVSMYEKEYDPSNPASEKTGILRDRVSRVTPAQEVDYSKISNIAKNVGEMTTSEAVEWLGNQGGGYGKAITSSSTSEQVREALKETIISNNQVGLTQQYLTEGGSSTGLGFEQWADRTIDPLMPKNTTSEKLIVDQDIKDANAMARARAGKGGGSVPFELTSVTVSESKDGNQVATDYSMWGAGDETIDGTKVAGVVWKDGKLLPKTVEFGVTEDESLAINYINKKNASFGEGEKVTQQDVIGRLRSSAPTERGFDPEFFNNVEDNLKKNGGFFNDDEAAFMKWLADETGLNMTPSKDNTFPDVLSKFLKDNEKADFTTEKGRENIANFLKENLPEPITRSKEKGTQAQTKETPAERAARIARGG